MELHLLVMYHFTKVIQKCTKLFFNHYLNAKEYGKCIVDIDEFQQIEYYPEKNMEAILRTYIQYCSNDNFIFSGSERHIISKMFSEKAHPFYNSADIMNLEVIPLDKYTEFCEKLFHKFDKQNNSFLQHSSKDTPCALRAACRVHSRNCSTFISYQPRKLHTI